MVYYPDLAVAALLGENNIISESTNKEQKIEDKITATDGYLTCLLFSGAYTLRYNKLNMELKNNYIMGFNVYAQDPPGLLKLLNNYIEYRGKTENSRKHLKKNRWEYH